MSFDHSLSTTSTPTTAAGGGESGGTVFTALPRDIIHTQILTKLDSLALASVGCTSTQFHSLCINEDLWRKICEDTWPSIKDPRARIMIDVLPFGYRSLFSNSFSSLRQNDCDCGRDLSVNQNELISAVDMHYKGRPVYSKVQLTNTLTCGPTWVDMMSPKENIAPNRAEFGTAEGDFLSHVAKNVTLSWIMIDSTRKLTTNLSRLQPVLVQRHFLKGHVWIRYSTILTTADTSSEKAEIRIAVTCGIYEGGEVQVKEMNMMVLDKYGENMKWKDSLVILQEHGRRENVKGREKYEEYLKRTAERRREKEMALAKGYKIEGIICMLLYSVVLIPIIPWSICYFFKRYILRRGR